MVKFAALEVTAKAIWWQGRDTPLLMVVAVLVVVVWWRMARAEHGISASFHPLCWQRVGQAEERKGWRKGGRVKGEKDHPRYRMGNEAR